MRRWWKRASMILQDRHGPLEQQGGYCVPPAYGSLRADPGRLETPKLRGSRSHDTEKSKWQRIGKGIAVK
jgi:hypothetical protein